MAKLTVKYRKVFQTRQYESDEINLSLEEEVEAPPVSMDRATAKERAHHLGELVRILHQQLCVVGDQLFADRLAVPDPREKAVKPVPPQGRVPRHG